MDRIFNVTGSCDPKRHYMVDLTSRLEEIKKMIDRGDYFAINKGRQYGKTTILQALENYLKDEYVAISLDFQMMSAADFKDEVSFVNGFTRELEQILPYMSGVEEDVNKLINEFIYDKKNDVKIADLFTFTRKWCSESEKPIVLIIDEVDTASNNQVFLDFLAQLRAMYLRRNKMPTFQSVILAGVYDIRNIKR